MKVLFVSNLFPDAAEPERGIYNARLVKYLGELCEIRVVSPRPTRGLPPLWSPRSFTPRPEDTRFAPLFPPAAYLPMIGSRWNHRLMAKTLRSTVQSVRTEFPFERLLVSWVYPDACAMAELAQTMDFPFVAIAQGSDVHQYLQIPTRRKIILSSLDRAQSVVTRSQKLADLLCEAGLPEQKLHTIYNGVETEVFKPGDRAAARSALGLAPDETILLFVGNFLPIKNPLLLLEAFEELRRQHRDKKFRLVMLGDGPLRPDMERLIREFGLDNQVSLPGRKSPVEVARFMQAADLLCVPSDNEGVPNVVLEALACGLRVVATKVGGLPEIITNGLLGNLVPRGDSVRFADGIAKTLSQPPEPEKINAYAAQFSWPRTAAACLQLLEQPAGSGEFLDSP